MTKSAHAPFLHRPFQLLGYFQLQDKTITALGSEVLQEQIIIWPLILLRPTQHGLFHMNHWMLETKGTWESANNRPDLKSCRNTWRIGDLECSVELLARLQDTKVQKRAVQFNRSACGPQVSDNLTGTHHTQQGQFLQRLIRLKYRNSEIHHLNFWSSELHKFKTRAVRLVFNITIQAILLENPSHIQKPLTSFKIRLIGLWET